MPTRLPLPVRHGRAETGAACLVVVPTLAGDEPTSAPEALVVAETPATAMSCTRCRHRREDPLEQTAAKRCQRGRICGGDGKGRKGTDTLNRPGAGIYTRCEGGLRASHNFFISRAVFAGSARAIFLGCPVNRPEKRSSPRV